MCYTLFAASEAELPLVPWDRRRRSFHVNRPRPSETSVGVQFSLPYIYYLGSHIQCGCGFRRSPWQPAGVVDEAEGEPFEIERTHRELYRWVRHGLEFSSEIQLYGCWWGEFRQRSRGVRKLYWKELDRPDFAFRERQLLRVYRYLPSL